MVTGGREADSCRSDGHAIAGGLSVDTGTHERVANWSQDSVAAVDPCDPGTDPRNGRLFCRYPPRGTFFLVLHGKVPEIVVLRRDFLHLLAEVSPLTLPFACRSAVGWSIFFTVSFVLVVLES